MLHVTCFTVLHVLHVFYLFLTCAFIIKSMSNCNVAEGRSKREFDLDLMVTAGISLARRAPR